MYQYLKKAVKFLISGLLTVAVLLGPLIYREVLLQKQASRVDQVANLIATDTDFSSYQLDQPRCDADEFTWLACGIYFEARNQEFRGQYYVAQVILNRVEDPRWPASIEAVVREGENKRNRCQFSFMCDGRSERITDTAAWQQALEVATLALEDYYDGMSATCAHSYHADYVESPKALRWFATLSETETIGAHKFFCD